MTKLIQACKGKWVRADRVKEISAREETDDVGDRVLVVTDDGAVVVHCQSYDHALEVADRIGVDVAEALEER